MPGRDDDRGVPLPTPGAQARRELWRPGTADEAEADRLGTTRALTAPRAPAVTEALGVQPFEPPPAGKSLVAFVLVLVQRLYLALEQLVEGVNAIREALAREPKQPAWATELARALPRLETAVSGLPDTEVVRGLRQDLQGVSDSIATVTRRFDRAEAPRASSGPLPAPQSRELPAGVRETIDRIDAAIKTLADARTIQRVPERLEGVERKLDEIGRRDEASLRELSEAIVEVKLAVERIERGRRDPDATVVLPAPKAAKPFSIPLVLLVICGLIFAGAMAVVMWSIRPQQATVVAPQQTELVNEIRALRDSNAALAAKVEKIVRCGHEECPRSALNATTGQWDRTQCRWVVEQCPDLPEAP